MLTWSKPSASASRASSTSRSGSKCWKPYVTPKPTLCPTMELISDPPPSAALPISAGPAPAARPDLSSHEKQPLFLHFRHRGMNDATRIGSDGELTLNAKYIHVR